MYNKVYNVVRVAGGDVVYLVTHSQLGGKSLQGWHLLAAPHDVQAQPRRGPRGKRQRTNGYVDTVSLRQCAMVHEDEWLTLKWCRGWRWAATCDREELGICAIQDDRQLVLRCAALDQQFL